jgi:hypothetical protein
MRFADLRSFASKKVPTVERDRERFYPLARGMGPGGGGWAMTNFRPFRTEMNHESK